MQKKIDEFRDKVKLYLLAGIEYEKELETKDARIKELEGELEAFKTITPVLDSQKTDARKKVSVLTAQLEKLTKCDKSHIYCGCDYGDKDNRCQGCKNKAVLDKGEK